MGTPPKEQLEHRHSAADPACEGCHGSGWLTALVDDPDTLANAGCQAPCDFVMACSECSVYDGDYAAIPAARRAGMTVAWTPTAGRLSEAGGCPIARQPPPGGGRLLGERRSVSGARVALNRRQRTSGAVGRMPRSGYAPSLAR